MALKIKLLKKIIDTYGETVRGQMLDGAKSGMLDQAKKMKRKGEFITPEILLKEIRKNEAFLQQMMRVNITMVDFETMAKEVASEVNY